MRLWVRLDQISDQKARLQAAELSVTTSIVDVLPQSAFVSETSDVTDELLLT